jgi:uncharacterized protein YmfQ (DUF2313 family)
METKTCKLINGQFCWSLIVDDQNINFVGSANADYFEKHYSDLGYKIERIDKNEE